MIVRAARGGAAPPFCEHLRRMSLTAARRDFADDEALLTDVLREVIAMGDGADDRCACSTTRSRSGRRPRLGDAQAADRLAALVAGLSLDETEVLVRSLTRWFQLVNLAEDNERVRRLRRPRRLGPRAPARRLAAPCDLGRSRDARHAPTTS